MEIVPTAVPMEYAAGPSQFTEKGPALQTLTSIAFLAASAGAGSVRASAITNS